MGKSKEKTKEIKEKLLRDEKHIAKTNAEIIKPALEFCEGYKLFLDKGKTEREAASYTVELLEKSGYREFKSGSKPKPGSKIYIVNRGKAVIACTVGKNNMEKGFNITAAHIDSPRLDLKPNPLYEAADIAYFKTHYYGGIRKYQWVTIPLSMHGVVIKKDGSKVEINIGEQQEDPVFCITDLLPHLSAEQNKRSLSEGIKGEELNIVIGSLPFAEETTDDAVKLETMRLINQKYGITEHDFIRAEIEFVPAYKASDIGFDRSMIGAYGQDDRVCAYTALMAEINAKSPAKTTVCVLCDKEEVGSNGNTGLAGEYMFHFLEELCNASGANYHKALASSICLSADVNAAFDPGFPDVFEKRNSSFMNMGVVLSKYGGARGKSSTSDASAELMGYVTNLMDKHNVRWQVGELGKVDAGGGGTIAMFVANKNVDVLDVGVAVLSMHSPFEITGKLDVYSAYLAFSVFINDDGCVQ